MRLHREVRRTLEPSWYDEEDLLDAAAEALEEGHPLAGELGRVVVYLPERISLHGASLLRAVTEQGQQVVVVAGTTGDSRADAATDGSVERLGGSPGAPRHEFDPMHVVDASRTRIVTVSDADEEVRAALRAVIGAVRTGTRLDRIALGVRGSRTVRPARTRPAHGRRSHGERHRGDATEREGRRPHTSRPARAGRGQRRRLPS